MNDFAFYLTPHEIGYFGAVIQNIPHDIIDLYIGPPSEGITSFDCISPEFQRYINELRDAKYNVFPCNHSMLSNYRLSILSSAFLSRRQVIFDWQYERKTSMIGLYHSVDAPAKFSNLPPSYYILAHQRQAQTAAANKIVKSEHPAVFTQMMCLPHEMINEYAYTGLYHLGEWAEKRHSPKDCLRAELEEKLQASLPADKPVVAFLQDEFCHPQQVKQALGKLIPHVSLIIKSGSSDEPLTVMGAYTWPDRTYAPNLLRFAADFILAGYHSGTLASSTMLGLAVIPYYTSLIHFGGRTLGKLDKFTAYLPRYFKGQHVCKDILEQINPPVNLMDSQAVLQRMHDSTWWSSYVQCLPTAQKNIFGDYCIEGAAVKTARLFVRAFSRGSFGEDAVAVSLRPEYGKLVKFSIPVSTANEVKERA